MLLNQDISLQKLQINASNDESMYVVKDHHDFHQALSHQPSLRSLLLRADPEPASRDDVDTLMDAFCSLKELRELRLNRTSDFFRDENIITLVEQLTNLEDLYIGGFGISDSILPHLAKLKNLKVITFSGLTSFSDNGLLDFVSSLGKGNHGLTLSVDLADPDTAISQESQDLIRETMAQSLDGRFDYQLLRGAPSLTCSNAIPSQRLTRRQIQIFQNLAIPRKTPTRHQTSEMPVCSMTPTFDHKSLVRLVIILEPSFL